MQLTDLFASTAALTIPVLIVAGALEFRNLADTVDKQVTKVAGQLIDDINPAFVMSAASSDDIDLTRLRSLLRLIKVMSRGYAIFVPFIWSVVLLFSGVTEVLCFLRLAEVYKSSSLVLLSIISIGIVILLLTIAPVILTAYGARSTPYQGFQTERIIAQIRREIPSGREFRQLSTEERQQKIERIKSIILNDSPGGT